MNAYAKHRHEPLILPSGAEVIKAADYPPVMRSIEAAQFLAHLRSEEIQKRGEHAIAASRDALRDAVHLYVRNLEEACHAFNVAELYAQAHEIRGLAETAGLGAAGRISSGLCRYLDALTDTAITPDGPTVHLHVKAIGRATRAHDEANALINTVADQLTVLVIRKLEEAQVFSSAGDR